MPRPRWLSHLLACCLAAPLAAQAPLQPGATVTGRLTANDPQFRDSTRFHRFVLPLHAGRAVTVDLLSEEFDAYLILESERGGQLARSDDGGGGCNARLAYRAPDDSGGPFVVVVNTARRGQLGHYTLRVTEGTLPPEAQGRCRFKYDSASAAPPAPGGARAIAPGQTVLGAVTAEDDRLPSDSTYAQAWTIAGHAGETVTIDLQSDEFDSFLYLDGPGIDRPLQDDDSGGNCNARLTATFPETGTYTIVVNTAVRRAIGRFALSVISGSKPASLARCARLQ